MTPSELIRSSSIMRRPRAARRRSAAAAPALDGQAELGHQPVGERRLVQPGQAHRVLPAAYLDPGAGRQVDGAPAVAPQHAGALGAGQHLDRHHGRRRDHHRPGEQGVRAERHDAAAPRPAATRSGRRR